MNLETNNAYGIMNRALFGGHLSQYYVNMFHRFFCQKQTKTFFTFFAQKKAHIQRDFSPSLSSCHFL